MKLDKYFTEEEKAFIEEYAKQRGLKIQEAIIALAREMIQTYNLKFLSGQQVLALIDLLSMKIPQWISFQLNMVGQSAMQVNLLSKQLSTLTQPSTLDKIIDLLQKTDLGKMIMALAPLFTSQAQKTEGEQDNEQNQGETWL